MAVGGWKLHAVLIEAFFLKRRGHLSVYTRMIMHYLVYLVDSGSAVVSLDLFTRVMSDFRDLENPRISLEKGQADLDHFEEMLGAIIKDHPKELMVFPVMIVDFENWLTAQTFLDGIHDIRNQYRNRTPISISPVLFIRLVDFFKIKNKLKAMGNQVYFQQIYIISDRFSNGNSAQYVDWALLFELFIETLKTIEENEGFLRRDLISLPSLSSFGFKLMEVPIRKIAKQEALKSYGNFTQQQLHDDKSTFEPNCLQQLKEADVYIRERYNISSSHAHKNKEKSNGTSEVGSKLNLLAETKFNPFVGKGFEDFDISEKDEELILYVREKVTAIIDDAYSQVMSELNREYSNWVHHLFVDKITEYEQRLKKDVAGYFFEGTLGAFQRGVKSEFDKVDSWQQEMPQNISVLTKKDVNIEAETHRLTEGLKELKQLITSWFYYKSHEPYLKPFIATFILIIAALAYAAYKSPLLPLKIKVFPYYILVSISLSLLISVSIRRFFVDRAARSAQQKLEDLALHFSRIHQGLLKRFADSHLEYITNHISNRMSRFMSNMLKSLRTTAKAFRDVMERKDFSPITTSDSEIITIRNMSHELEDQLRKRVRETLPRWREPIYSGFMKILSSKEVENRVTNTIIDLESRALRVLRNEFTIQGSHLRDNAIDYLHEGCRALIPLPLSGDIERRQSRLRSMSISYQPRNLEIQRVSTDQDHVLYWRRSESLMAGIFYGGINPEDIQCPKE